MSLVIVDYGMGNLRSVSNAFKLLGTKVDITSDPKKVIAAEKLVLPGVGAFGDAVKELKKKKMLEAVKKFISSGKHYLGICLGLQLLFEESEEASEKGLGIFKGKVNHFRKKEGFKIPHMGWNSVRLSKPLDGIGDGSFYYFVHSYYAEPVDKTIIAGSTEYGGAEFASAILKENVIATQFHPEKSQALGLKFLKKFIEL
ncbi:MAG: imidazole glycerol phosphate synthase subunit HisH [Candidatus Omnitrophica bacterium]|nr:imidazole glycerol phosphate synthase subunit HisH [Candidatus Omnitrophota bacterium]